MEIAKEIVEIIQGLPLPKLIGISGFGGSGKSTFAKALGSAIDAPVIGVDSFLRDGVLDAQYKLWEIVDFARLDREVLQAFLNKDKAIQYGHFNIPSKAILEMIDVKNAGQLIVEGIGLFRPKLLKYFSYKIWIDCPLETAILRGKKRDREEYYSPSDECWDGIWRENDIQYLQTFEPKKIADLIIPN